MAMQTVSLMATPMAALTEQPMASRMVSPKAQPTALQTVSLMATLTVALTE
jgi:hypothetical protein